MILQANVSQKKVGVAILISDKINFKPKKVTRDNNGHYIITKGTIHQENITVINTNAPNSGGPKYIKQLFFLIKQLLTHLKRESDERENC